MKLKTTLALAILVAVFFAVIVFMKDYLGAQAFFMAAVSLVMFSIIGPFGDYFKAGLGMLVGIIVAFASIVVMAAIFPLPPDNTVYVALVSAISIFLLVALSPTGLSMPGMFIGWTGGFAAVYNIYLSDPTLLSSAGLAAVSGMTAALLLGLCMSAVVVKIAMAVNK